MKIVIVDYGAGNVESIRNAIYQCGFDAHLASTPEEISSADRIVLPGVGAAGRALDKLRLNGLADSLHDAVCVRGRPMLGICLGMQLLAEELHEFGHHRGLGWIRGSVQPLQKLVGGDMKVPHMGWSKVSPAPSGKPFFEGIGNKGFFFFSHSFGLVSEDSAIVAATVDYGVPLTAAVRWQSVFATQFHPEKSQIMGNRLLTAFFDWNP